MRLHSVFNSFRFKNVLDGGLAKFWIVCVLDRELTGVFNYSTVGKKSWGLLVF